MKRQKIRKLIGLMFFLSFPIIMNFLSPYLIVVGAFNGVVGGSLIVFASLLLLSILFGRIFCGWICPMAFFQESCFPINSKSIKKHFVKFIFWIPWITSILIGFFAAGGIIKIDFLYMTENGISVDGPEKYIIYYGVILIFLLLSIFCGKRAGCHYICWMSPFMILGTKMGKALKIPRLHIKARKELCISCKKCDSKCPMSLDVSLMAKENSFYDQSECIICGECVDCCPKKVLKFDFSFRRDL